MAFLNWTTSLPSSWETKPLKAVASYTVSSVDKVPAEDELPVRLCNYTDVYKNEVITPEMELMQTTATKAEIEKFRLLKDDVVITKDSESWDDMAIPALVVDSADDLLCGYHLAILRPEQKAFSGRFLFRCLQAKPIRLQLELASTGVTRFGLPKDEIGKLLLPVPPLEDQRRIADYLDAEITQIDALLAEKKRMLALLAEKRTALVSRAVTYGLDPNAPMKPSGLEWLGDIPAHWEIIRLKWFLESLTQGWSPQASNIPAAEGEVGVLKLSAISQGSFYPAENKSLKPDEDYPSELGLKKGDVLITRSNTPALVGESCSIPCDFPNLLIADLIYKLRVRRDLLVPEFLSSFLATPAARSQIRRDARGSSGTMVKISQEHIQNWLILLPPLSEQQNIITTITRECSRIAKISKSLTDSLSLLKERRNALITAAVTGQIKPEAMAV